MKSFINLIRNILMKGQHSLHSPFLRIHRTTSFWRRLVLAVFLLCCGFAPMVQANPFLSSGSSETNEGPLVRPPASTGPFTATQLDLREQLVQYLESFREHPQLSAVFAVLAAAFAYGVLHAAGPGHRKTIVFSLFLGKTCRIWDPLMAGFFSAFVHAGSGIILILGLSLIRGTIIGLGTSERIREYLDAGTFVVLAGFAVLLLLYRGWSFFRPQPKGLNQEAPTTQKTPTALNTGIYTLLFTTSLVPCPGAMMVLLFSLYGQVLWLGIVSVVSMSIGMGLIISLVGYLAYAGNQGLFWKLRTKGPVLEKVSHGMELFSYILLIGFSLYNLEPLIANLSR
jgi:nickel/cobalt exporter